MKVTVLVEVFVDVEIDESLRGGTEGEEGTCSYHGTLSSAAQADLERQLGRARFGGNWDIVAIDDNIPDGADAPFCVGPTVALDRLLPLIELPPTN